MYNRAYIDRNIKRQAWFNRMDERHKILLLALFFDDIDPIGIVEPDFKWLDSLTGGLITEDDIDIDSFIEDCNNDGKERMMIVDRTKLWFNPTVIFNGANESGMRIFTTNFRDVSVIKQLAQREVTRTWFIELITYQDHRVTVKPQCLNMVYNQKNANDQVRSFAKRIGDVIGHKVLVSGEQPEAIKQSFGNQCQYCGEIFEEYELEIDHIVPVSKGGKDILINKVPACKSCNSKKADMDVFKFLQNEGFEATEGLKSRLEKLQKKRLISGAPSAIFKKLNKKDRKKYTWEQVNSIHFSQKDTRTQSDFITIDEKDQLNRPYWVQL